MLCLCSIASVVFALGSPAATADAVVGGAAGTTAQPAEIPVDGATPLAAGSEARPPASAASLPVDGLAPLSATPSSDAVSAPPSIGTWTPSPSGPVSLPTDGLAPLARGDARNASFEPSPGPERRASRWAELVRIELLVGPVWRIRTAEMMSLASVEVGRQRGFSGTVQGGIIVAPDRRVVAVADFPIGAGFVFRHRFGQRSLHGSVGVTAGLLVHRAATDLGVIHRVDPDLQLPLRFTWTAGKVGLSVALLQGLSTRVRTYARRGTEVWHRIPYRIGFAVGIHFDVGVGRTRSRRSNTEPKGP